MNSEIQELKRPNEFCVVCIEKHISTAMSLAHEIGYVDINRPFIIGELGAAQLHIGNNHPVLFNFIREARHLVQHGKESEIDWVFICKILNELVQKNSIRK